MNLPNPETALFYEPMLAAGIILFEKLLALQIAV
jgi:hypothetical protein